MENTPTSRRAERVEKQKKNNRKWIATGAAAVILLCGGAIAYNNFTQERGNSTAGGQVMPATCSTTQTVTVATTEPMAEALGAMPVDEDSCITLDITTDKTASDVLSEATEGAGTTNLWIPDSTTRAELAMSQADAGLTPLAESLASTPGVLVSGDGATYPTWQEALADLETVSLGDPKEDPGAFVAMMSGVAEVSDGMVSLENLTAATGARAQSIGITEPAQSATELLEAVDAGSKDAAVVTEADYAAYTAEHDGAELTASVPGGGSFMLNYPLYQATSSNNTTIDEAAQQIIDFMTSQEGQEALTEAGLRPADGTALGDGRGVSDFTQLTPSNQDALTQIWTSYALQSAPLNALVMLDASGSMLQAVEGTDQNRMDITVESVLAGSQLFPARDSMGLWKFSRAVADPNGPGPDYQELVPVRGVEETVDGKTQRQLLQEAGLSIAGDIHPDDQTPLYDATLAAFNSAQENYKAGSVNAIIVITDGQNTAASSITQEELISQIQQRQDPNNPIFMILIGISEDADMAALDTIAQQTGGEAYVASSPADIQRIFAEALTGVAEAAASGAQQ